MTGMRLNLSHTTLVESKVLVENYQSAAQKLGIKPQILIDMQGPELRIGKVQEPLVLEAGEKILLDRKVDEESFDSDMYKKRIPVPVEVTEALEAGAEVLLDDGKILLEMEDAETARVLRGGELKSHKSIKIIGKTIRMPALTEHDIANIQVAKEYGVTALMQPFAIDGAQLEEVRGVLRKYGAHEVQIYAKIENHLGVEHLEDILPKADVIIIARGDLGNDMPLWELPAVQKQIEQACKEAGKPYIVVTQMLASMEHNPVPTRAEVSDIYHAVYHGAWGVMLTGETAVGQYPIESIRYLANTAKVAETDLSK